MALDSTGRVITTWTDAEIADNEGFVQTDFEKLCQNQIAAKNLLESQVNTWTEGQNIADHLCLAPPTSNPFAGYRGFINDDGSNNNDLDDHYASFSNATQVNIQSSFFLEADKVPMFMEARVKLNLHSSGRAPFVGLCTTGLTTNNHLLETDCCSFTTGASSNTWLAGTRSSSVTRTTTDDIAGNYIDWDILRVELDDTNAKFYVNGVLEATHSTLPPTSAHLYARVSLQAAFTTNYFVDYIRFGALENSVSP